MNDRWIERRIRIVGSLLLLEAVVIVRSALTESKQVDLWERGKGSRAMGALLMTEKLLVFVHKMNDRSTIGLWKAAPLLPLVHRWTLNPLVVKGMRISIGGDHAGVGLKQALKRHLQDQTVEVLDLGTNSTESTDYPDYAHAVAKDVESGTADLGIVVCGSANGVNITANKHHGVRSAIAWNEDVARLAREHNNANVLALPARFVDEALALRIVDAFLAARFEGGRHQRRVEKIEPIPVQRP